MCPIYIFDHLPDSNCLYPIQLTKARKAPIDRDGVSLSTRQEGFLLDTLLMVEVSDQERGAD